MWERHEEFQPMLTSAWSTEGRARSVGELNDKLRNTAGSILGWCSQSFGAVRTELRKMRSQLQALGMKPSRVWPDYEEKKVEQKIIELSFREEIMWRQRARVQWLTEGDKNTRFFYQKASNRKNKNRITRLVDENGTVHENPNDLEKHTVEFFKDLYTSEAVIGTEEVLSQVPCKVSSDMNETLNAPYTAEEVKVALYQMFPTKAPGPDGYPAHFFRSIGHYVVMR
jgi:hypothetical protein